MQKRLQRAAGDDFLAESGHALAVEGRGGGKAGQARIIDDIHAVGGDALSLAPRQQRKPLLRAVGGEHAAERAQHSRGHVVAQKHAIRARWRALGAQAVYGLLRRLARRLFRIEFPRVVFKKERETGTDALAVGGHGLHRAADEIPFPRGAQAQRVDDFNASGFAEYGGFGLAAHARVADRHARLQGFAQADLLRCGDLIDFGIVIVRRRAGVSAGKEELLVLALDQPRVFPRALHQQFNGVLVQTPARRRSPFCRPPGRGSPARARPRRNSR